MQNISQKFIQLLTQYVALQSISTDISYQTEIDKTVEFLAGYMTTTGAVVTVIPGSQVNRGLMIKFMRHRTGNFPLSSKLYLELKAFEGYGPQ